MRKLLLFITLLSASICYSQNFFDVFKELYYTNNYPKDFYGSPNYTPSLGMGLSLARSGKTEKNINFTPSIEYNFMKKNYPYLLLGHFESKQNVELINNFFTIAPSFRFNFFKRRVFFQTGILLNFNVVSIEKGTKHTSPLPFDSTFTSKDIDYKNVYYGNGLYFGLDATVGTRFNFNQTPFIISFGYRLIPEWSYFKLNLGIKLKS